MLSVEENFRRKSAGRIIVFDIRDIVQLHYNGGSLLQTYFLHIEFMSSCEGPGLMANMSDGMVKWYTYIEICNG